MASLTAADRPRPETAPVSGSAAARPTDRSAARLIGWWLVGCAGMVFAMAVIGAITRLTESGLSMVEWRPLIGALPPLSEAEWQRVFDLYRDTPEYRLKNAGMSLAEFKTIFFWEWFHRLWGRLIGLVFALPLLAFWLTGRIRRVGHVPHLDWKLAGLLVLGALQGVMGWVMVQSGLVDRPSVSQYRLAAHLGLAFVIFGLLLWLAWRLFEDPAARAATPAPRPVRGHLWGTVAIAAVTVLWGALVAGLDAGLAYNSWPLMDGRLLPPEALNLVPWWLNPVENTAMVQFVHRWLAIVTAAAVLALAVTVRRRRAATRVRRVVDLAAAMVVVQVGLGIATLLSQVWIPVAALHQAGALVLIALLLRAGFLARAAA